MTARGDQPTPGTPGWVKLLLVAGLVLAAVFVGLHLAGSNPFGSGGHGP
jgi:hypothetical protein